MKLIQLFNKNVIFNGIKQPFTDTCISKLIYGNTSN